ncbi:MAG: hypothetical protein ACI9WL_000081 [Rubritalea sp.]|jgi:hypothetical protein
MGKLKKQRYGIFSATLLNMVLPTANFKKKQYKLQAVHSNHQILTASITMEPNS